MREPATPIVKPKITYGAVVGQVIQHHRKRAGIGQEAVAQALGITQSAYSRLEQGQSAMTVTQLRVIAERLRTAAASLLHQADLFAARLHAQGVEVTDEKGVSPAAVLVALGILAAILASRK